MIHLKLSSLISLLCLISLNVKADWKNESELSLFSVSGNTTSEAYNAKTALSKTFDLNTLSVGGKYLNATANGVESAKSWEAGARYERALSDDWSAFLGHGAESNVYSGYVQKDNTDLGGKYFFTKSDETKWFAEAGARLTRTNPVGSASPKSETFGRLYTEYSSQINKGVNYKFWVEYLPNFTDAKGYLVNAEPSVSVILSETFSLKTAYLVKYKNLVSTGMKYTDTQLTTSLVAKF